MKSGKDYTVHRALDKFLKTPDYHIRHAVVFSNEREVRTTGGITCLPVYYCIFYRHSGTAGQDVILPEVPFPD